MTMWFELCQTDKKKSMRPSHMTTWFELCLTDVVDTYFRCFQMPCFPKLPTPKEILQSSTYERFSCQPWKHNMQELNGK